MLSRRDLTALLAWEGVGVGCERACTLGLLPFRLDEACAEFENLGVAMPPQL